MRMMMRKEEEEESIELEEDGKEEWEEDKVEQEKKRKGWRGRGGRGIGEEVDDLEDQGNLTVNSEEDIPGELLVGDTRVAHLDLWPCAKK